MATVGRFMEVASRYGSTASELARRWVCMASASRFAEVASRYGLTASELARRWITPVSVLAVAPLPLIALRAQMLWARPYYQFLPFVPLGAAVLAWGKCRMLGPLEPGPRREVVPLAIAAWLLLAISSIFVLPWLGSVAGLTMLVAAIAAIGGVRLLRSSLPAWAFLGIAAGLPLKFDQMLVSGLQAITSRIASLALDGLGIFHVMEGNVVAVSDRVFGVEEACSGIYSLFSVLFCTLFYVLWARRPPVRAVLTMVSGACWVLGGNIVRVVAVVDLATCWGVDVSHGWRHDLLSLVVFVATLLLVASTECVIDLWPAIVRFLRPPQPDPWAPDETVDEEDENGQLVVPPVEPPPAVEIREPTRLPSIRATLLWSWPVAVSFGCLGLVQVVALVGVPLWRQGANLRFTRLWVGSMSSTGLPALQADSLPARSGNFRRTEFKTETRAAGSSLGEMSRYWRYQFGDSTATVSVDFPFQEWHELTVCYRGQGWRLRERQREGARDLAAPDGAGGRPPIVVANLTKGPGRHGYLLFCSLDELGNALEPDGLGIGGRLRNGLGSWLNLGDDHPKHREARPGSALFWSYQVQLFIESDYPLIATERDEARAFFDEVLATIRRQVPDAGGAGS